MNALPRPVRVVGIGSPSGDDAVGWVVVEQLEKANRTFGVTFHRLASLDGLCDVMEGAGSLVLIDAAEPAGSPGTVHRLVGLEDRLKALRPGTTHDIGVWAALKLADLIGSLPRRVVVFAVEAADLSPREGLSPEVEAALPELVRQVADEWSREDMP